MLFVSICFLTKNCYFSKKHIQTGDYYTEILASYIGENGKKVDTVLPQYILMGNMYDEGHVRIIADSDEVETFIVWYC